MPLQPGVVFALAAPSRILQSHVRGFQHSATTNPAHFSVPRIVELSSQHNRAEQPWFLSLGAWYLTFLIYRWVRGTLHFLSKEVDIGALEVRRTNTTQSSDEKQAARALKMRTAGWLTNGTA